MPKLATTPITAKDAGIDLPIILASSSKYRKQLLSKLEISFDCYSPEIDETPRINESIDVLVERLATEKALKTAALYKHGLVIGSDQAAITLDAHNKPIILGKPHTDENAFKQLKLCSGQSVIFKTGLCVFDIDSSRKMSCVEDFTVNFRELTESEILRYIELEQPLDCAGSFKSEGLGIRLFSSMQGKDPNALVGLPLITLIDFLLAFGVDPLSISAKQR